MSEKEPVVMSIELELYVHVNVDPCTEDRMLGPYKMTIPASGTSMAALIASGFGKLEEHIKYEITFARMVENLKLDEE